MKAGVIFILTTVIISLSNKGSASVEIRNNVGSRIIGGANAAANQFPFAAAITVRTADSTFFCGGTLFKNRWIITAGQCVDGAILFTIHLGSIYLDADDSNRLTLATSEYFLHPEYNPLTLENDIGVIQFRSPISLANHIRPVDWLSRSEVDSESDLTAIGWGQISDYNSSHSSTLQYVKVAALSNEECRITYGNQIKDGMICVEGNYNEGICHGDTGSALMESYNRRYIILSGVASFISGNGCESTDPSGYTRVFNYERWIHNVTGF